MARIDKIERATMERNSVHNPVDATYTVFQDGDGRPILQIDTYGSESRQLPGKKSQSLQFSSQGLEALRRILQEI